MEESSSQGDVVAIELLKARYCRYLDTKDWAAFRSLFTADFVSDTVAAGGLRIEGADAFVDFVRSTLARSVTVHQVQQPEIDLLGATSARGVWAMQDVVRFAPMVTMHGFGHYHETYEKHEGRWLVASSQLTRLREEIQTPVFSVFVSDRMRNRIGRASRRWMGGAVKQTLEDGRDSTVVAGG